MPTQPGTANGSATHLGDGTVPTGSDLLVPVVPNADGTAGTERHGTVDGHGTERHGHEDGHGDGSILTVPVSRPATARIAPDRNRGTVPTENRAHVSTVPVPTVTEPAATTAASVKNHASVYRIPLTIVVAIVASLGQSQYAKAHGFVHLIQLPAIHGPLGFSPMIDFTPWLAVAVFDLSVAALLYSGRTVWQMGMSPWLFWDAAMCVSAFSIFTNTQHEGGWVTAPASAVLFLLYFLTLYYEYAKARKDRGDIAEAPPKLLMSVLTIIEPGLARRAWIIACTRPLARGVAYRATLGEKIGARDLAILAARLYRDILADQMILQLGTGDADKSKRVRFWQWRTRKAAISRAVMTANDNVDFYMGLPVPERTGVRVARIGYAPAVEEPTPAPVPAPAVEEPTPAPVPAPRPPAARQPRTAAATEHVAGTVAPISAPPATVARRRTSAPAVPDMTAEELDLFSDKIANVQSRSGDAWWNGPRPLTVTEVQTEYGVGRRGHATIVARCLAHLRAQRLLDQVSVN